MTGSNYEKLVEYWGLKFLKMDQEALQKKLPLLRKSGDYLTIEYFNKSYGIHTLTGEIVCMNKKEEVNINSKLNIYNLCWFSSPQAYLMNKWVPFRELRNASVFAPAFERTILKPLAAAFSGQMERLEDACIRLGGKKLPYADVGYQISSFSCIPLQILFWDGDDEFPAKANILFDYSATDFIHVESTVTIAADGLGEMLNLRV